MGTIGATSLNLLDWAKRTAPDGSMQQVVELLAATNPVLEDMQWLEGNLPVGHLTTVRSGLPSVAWRRLYGGVQPSKSRTVQVTDTTGMLEAWATVDKDLLEINGMSAAFRLSEETAFIEALNQEMADTIFNGDTTTAPAEFMGLTPRYASTTAENGANIISGGSNDTGNTSIWLVMWGPRTCHGIFPKGSKAGLQMEDLGLDTVQDAAGGNFRAYQTHYQWKAGLTLRDWRYVVRIANIEVSDLTYNAGSGANLIELMIQAMHKLYTPSLAEHKLCFYCNRTVAQYLDRQTLNRAQVQLSYGLDKDLFGRPIMTFRGVPVRVCDAIGNAEALVS